MQLSLPRTHRALPGAHGGTAIEVRPDLWRVNSARGQLLGHVAVDRHAPEPSYAASRLHGAVPRKVGIGTFHTLEDAFAAFTAP